MRARAGRFSIDFGLVRHGVDYGVREVDKIAEREGHGCGCWRQSATLITFRAAVTMERHQLTPAATVFPRGWDITFRARVWACMLLGLLSCADDEEPKKSVGPDATVEHDTKCDASKLSASSFANCTCEGTEADPGPGTFGCATPRTIYNRVCMIDASCNAYSMPDYGSDRMKVATLRDDVAFRFEWAEPIPKDAHLGVNAPADGASALLSPFTFFAVQDPATYAYDFQEMSDAAEDAELVVSEDRKSVTLIPTRGCFEGHWYLQVNLDLALIYGGPVCGEQENIHPGYTAYYFIDD